MDIKHRKGRVIMCFEMFTISTGYIYFMQIEPLGPIKIGISNNPHKRLYHINTSSPYPVKLLYFTPGNMNDEKSIHRNFIEYRIRNEWFHPHESIFKMIENKKRIDRKFGSFMWEEFDPVKDLGDWSLGSDKWNEPWVIEIQNRIESHYKQEATA